MDIELQVFYLVVQKNIYTDIASLMDKVNIIFHIDITTKNLFKKPYKAACLNPNYTVDFF